MNFRKGGTGRSLYLNGCALAAEMGEAHYVTEVDCHTVKPLRGHDVTRLKLVCHRPSDEKCVDRQRLQTSSNPQCLTLN